MAKSVDCASSRWLVADSVAEAIFGKRVALWLRESRPADQQGVCLFNWLSLI